MKAFLIILVILVILAGVAFYFGWVQIHVPEGNYAVVSTKTRGVDDQVIRPGEFSWRVERLIPTNMTIHVFDLHPRSLQVPFQSHLPSAELYSSILPNNPDFSLRGTVSITFTILPESLPQLVAEDKLTPDGLDQFYQMKADQISKRALDRLLEMESDRVASANLDRDLLKELDSQFTDLEIIGLNTDLQSVPDLELYEMARSSYRSLLETRDRSRDQAIAELAEEQVREENTREAERANLEALREYGKLLDEYPILLKAMAVQKLSGEKVITIPEFDLKTILE
jgi:hypothetical protein